METGEACCFATDKVETQVGYLGEGNNKRDALHVVWITNTRRVREWRSGEEWRERLRENATNSSSPSTT